MLMILELYFHFCGDVSKSGVEYMIEELIIMNNEWANDIAVIVNLKIISMISEK